MRELPDDREGLVELRTYLNELLDVVDRCAWDKLPSLRKLREYGKPELVTKTMYLDQSISHVVPHASLHFDDQKAQQVLREAANELLQRVEAAMPVWSRPGTVKYWAKQFGVDEATFYRWRKKGQVRYKEMGGRIRIHLDDIPISED